MSEATDKIHKRLWESLPTVPVPNLEEIKISNEIKAAWERCEFPASPEQIFELAYRKGRIAGKDAASREILGTR